MDCAVTTAGSIPGRFLFARDGQGVNGAMPPENENPEGATPNEKPAEQTPNPEADKPKDEELGENGKKALEAERKARTDAEKRAANLQKQIDDANAAKAAKDDEDAQKKGEFETLAKDRKAKLDEATTTIKTVTQERDDLKTRLDARDEVDKAMVESWVKDNKGTIDDFLDYRPGPDASAEAQMAWFNATRPKVEKRTNDPVRGNGRNPASATTEQIQERIVQERLKSGIYKPF